MYSLIFSVSSVTDDEKWIILIAPFFPRISGNSGKTGSKSTWKAGSLS